MDSTVSTTDAPVTTDYPHHDEYKNSGVGWLGEIPDHWYTAKLKFLCSRSAVYGANRSADEYAEDGVRFLRTTDIDEGGKLRADGVHIDPNSVEEYMLDDGDLLLSRSGTVGRSFVYSSSEHEPAAYAGYLVRFVLDEKKLNSKYAFYFTKSGNFDEWLRSNSIESTIGNVSGDKYANMAVSVPPLDEQRAIAAYLDRETKRIDALIEKKDRLIDLLEEKRTSLVSRVVTKGLDRDVEMQDSEVEWLGEVPAHWETGKLKHLCQEIKDGLHHTPPKVNQERGIPFISTQHVRNRDIDFENATYVSKEDYEEGHPTVAPEPGDVLITLVGSIGHAAILPPEKYPISSTRHVGYVRPGEKLNAQYLLNYTESSAFERFIGLETSQVAQPSIYLNSLSNHIIPVPPVEEQKQIAQTLQRRSAQLNDLIGKVEDGIEYLQEYRTALISAAVTGQIDVREATGKPAGHDIS